MPGTPSSFTGIKIVEELNPQGVAISSTGNLEIVAGNLTLDAGNLAVTGNISTTGNETVTGTQVYGSALWGSGSSAQFNKRLAAVDMSAGVTAVTATVPNANASAVYLVLVRVGYAQASHTYDSTRVGAFLVTVTRVAGAAATHAISAVIGAQITTVSGGRTVTFTLTAGAVTGGGTASNACPLTLTTTPSTANDATEVDMTFIALSGGGGISLA